MERFEPTVPGVAELLKEAEEDLLAFYRFPQAHWPTTPWRYVSPAPS